MAQEILTTFQFKRGTAQRWIEVNPILKQGEPGFEYDTNKLKLGDGKSAWLDLPYITQDVNSDLVVVDNFQQLPVEGDILKIYKVNTEKSLYQWNSSTNKYEVLGGGSFDPSQITKINGGKANG